ncbi:hypothetical protein DPMN_080176 [Dreissena polymorpha]|uniref:Uncharacterized protein n=1 Tax=Dreissena polymorpha TaxID=45954 RepID=A0A9D3YS53_DREPO|nr:hypothetical protein DPMN_080176 [Dreissena polymorpha]
MRDDHHVGNNNRDGQIRQTVTVDVVPYYGSWNSNLKFNLKHDGSPTSSATCSRIRCKPYTTVNLPDTTKN